jgi:hypothetical protein
LKYAEKFAGKYGQRYPESSARLRRHACLHLNTDLYLDLDSKRFAELNRDKLEKSFHKPFEKLFASSLG